MIFISAGHSNTAPGAVGQGTTEASVVTEFRDMVAHYLKAENVPFIQDGSKGENLPLSQAIKLIPSRGVAVEFHTNAFTDPKATGVETLSNKKDFALGSKICQSISDILGIPNRGAKAENSGQHSRLGFVQAGGIIVELFYISNPSDFKKYQEKKWLVAKSIAKILMEEIRDKT